MIYFENNLRNSIVIIAIVIAVLLSGGIGYTIGTARTITSTQTTTQFVTSNSQQPEIANFVPGPGCQNFTQSGIALIRRSSSGNNSALAFLMNTNSQATVCVKYTLSSSLQSSATINLTSSIQVVNATGNQSSGYSYSYAPAAGVTIKPDPGSIRVGPQNESEQLIVNYTITASSNAKGVYTLGYDQQCPVLIPFAVGYGSAQISAPMFTGFLFPGSCGLTSVFSSNGVLVGYGGLGTEWIEASST